MPKFHVTKGHFITSKTLLLVLQKWMTDLTSDLHPDSVTLTRRKGSVTAHLMRSSGDSEGSDCERLTVQLRRSEEMTEAKYL